MSRRSDCDSTIPVGFKGDSYAVPLPRHLAPGDGDLSSLTIGAGGRLVAGRFHDIAVERGPLFRVQSKRSHKPRMTLDRNQQFEMRQISLRPTPLAVLQEHVHTPADVLLQLLREGLCDRSVLPVDERRRDERLVHGLMFLHLRRSLARALFEGREDYRELAIRGAERSAREGLAELERLDPDVAQLPEEARASLRQGLFEQRLDPHEGVLDSLLVSWLGDVDAADAMAQLELDVANRVLAGEGWDDAERVIQGWSALRALLPLATHARIVALLSPAYDPEREVVGFYRFMLPSPRRFGSFVGNLPPRPLGLATLDWATANSRVREVITGLRLVGVQTDRTYKKAIARDACPGVVSDARPDTALTLTLDEPGGDGEIEWTAFYHEGQRRPSCMRVAVAGEAPEVALVTRAAILRDALSLRLPILD